VGASGTVLLSEDGNEWKSQTSGTSVQLNAIAASDSEYVAVGNSGAVYRSTDGKNWTNRSISGQSNRFNGVTYGPNGFVAVGNGGIIYTSDDGINWVARASGTTNNLLAVAASDSGYVAVGDLSATVLQSTDGISWTTRSIPQSATYACVAASEDGIFVAATSSTSGYVIRSANNGVTWTLVTPDHIRPDSYYGAAYGLGGFVLVGPMRTLNTTNFNRPGIITSREGLAWTPHLLEGWAITWSNRAVAAGPNSFVVVGDGGRIITSP